MRLKQIGGMSLAAAVLASASVFGATAAQAADTETMVKTYESKSACHTETKKTVRILKLFGDRVYKYGCKEDITSFGGYRGYITYKPRI